MSFLLTLPLADAPLTEWDSPAVIIGKLLTIAALVGLNGFFVACEFAIIKVRASQLDTLVEEGDARARFAMSGYPLGPVAFFQFIDEWRTSGNFEGLTFRPR